MPVTPFHFGAGALVKAMAPRLISFSAFVCAQVVIDCETAYFMLLKHEWPFHRLAHTLIGGGLIGLATGAAMHAAGRLWLRLVERNLEPVEVALLPALVGGGLGGLSHSLLDAIMHDDVRPFAPFVEGNPIQGLIPLAGLHLGLVAAGFIGTA
jgi:hypothetical protein